MLRNEREREGIITDRGGEMSCASGEIQPHARYGTVCQMSLKTHEFHQTYPKVVSLITSHHRDGGNEVSVPRFREPLFCLLQMKSISF